MKYQVISPIICALLCLLSAKPLLAAEPSSSESAENQIPWFEIEVILFKHNTAKGTVDEDFKDQSLSNKKKRAVDLLTPYLQPNLTELKQLLPTCGQDEESLPYQVKTPALAFSTVDPAIAAEMDIIAEEIKKTQQLIELQQSNDNVSQSVLSATEGQESVSLEANQELNNLDSQGSTVQVQIENSTVKADNPNYQAITFSNFVNFPTDVDKELCIIAESDLTSIAANYIEQISGIDSIPVNKLVGTVNGTEQWQANDEGEITWASDKPYLISKESLRLKSINYRLKRSRDYKPLLHLGWRQKGESKRKAQAVNLFAGEHLTQDYQYAVLQQKEQQSLAQLTEFLTTLEHQRIERHLQQQLETQQALLHTGQTHSENELKQEGVLATDNVVASNKLKTPLEDGAQTEKNYSAAELALIENKQKQLDSFFSAYEAHRNSLNELNEETETNDKNAEALRKKKVDNIINNISSDITSLQRFEMPSNIDDEQNKSESKSDFDNIIEVPIQPWELDGLFKVHLDHYLYINTAFNLIDENKKSDLSKKEQKSKDDLNTANVISFKQSRRVITGEIHYFDHPHIGMVLQIRRFDPTKPAAEAVTQSIK